MRSFVIAGEGATEGIVIPSEGSTEGIVIPSEGAQRRSRGIAVIPIEGSDR